MTSIWNRSGDKGKYGIDLDISKDWYDSEDSKDWFTKLLDKAKTVDVLENGPAAGNPLFTITADDIDTLDDILKLYYTESDGSDSFDWEDDYKTREDAWADLINNYVYETAPQNMANEDNTPVTVTAEDKDADGDIDKIEAEKDKPEDDDTSDKPHDEELKPKSTGLAGDTTLEEELMLNPNMSPKEFNELAGKKRGAKKGEPAPDMDLNVLSDNTQKNIISALAERKW